MRRWISVHFAFLVWVTLIASRDVCPAQQAAPEVPDDRNVSTGLVTDPRGNPLSDVSITVMLWSPTDEKADRELATLSVTTDRNGCWRWDHEQYPQVLGVNFSKEGFIRNTLEFSNARHYVTVLDDAYTLQGTVRDSQGNPIPNAMVSIARQSNLHEEWSAQRCSSLRIGNGTRRTL